VFRLIPDDLEVTFDYAGVLLLAGDAEGYRRFCARLLERGDKLKCLDHPGRRSYLVARICLLAPDAAADRARPGQLAEEAVKAVPTFPHYLHALGVAHYRAGRYKQAVERLEESLKADPDWTGQPVNWLALALAEHHLGHADKAREWFDKATQALDKDAQERPPGALTGLGMHAHDWLACLLLRREAETELNSAAPSPGK
jgi:tetratricopeptide (TPR) repeat protein